MRRLLGILLVVALIMGTMSTCAVAAVTGDEALTFGTPFLITNAGQGPGGKMARLLASQTGTLTLDTDYFYLSEPQPEELDAGYSCLMIVIGSTDKGLGASGITIEDELARLEVMIAHAEEIEMPIIAVLLEKDKRSEISTNANERCIDAVCPHADWMIVVADGNTDGRFDALKAEYDIPLTVLDTSMDFTSLVTTSFVVGYVPEA